ncbi:Uncharacterised protein [Vibrio cholerae]|nr:Uncharacterised protein [Vibrio cholerae]
MSDSAIMIRLEAKAFSAMLARESTLSCFCTASVT